MVRETCHDFLNLRCTSTCDTHTSFSFPFLRRIVDASTELNYIFVLAGVAFLWRPQPNAKEYAFVMQLPSSKADEEDGEGEFEMAVVPSALDGDDDDEDEVEMFTDEPEH